MQVTGNYLLRLNFGGDTNVPVDPQYLKRFDIIQDMNKLLPSFGITLRDPQGAMTHIIPFDKGMSRISAQLGESFESPDYNDFDFMVYRRQPQGLFAAGNDYDIRGLLDMEGMFTPSYSRASSGTIKSYLEGIATDELKCDSTDVSPALGYEKTLLQTEWNNATFFNDLKYRLIGKNNEPLYFIYIKCKEGLTTFVCKSYNELAAEGVKYKFMIGDSSVQDFIPVFSYKIYDNYKIFGVFASKKQEYSYFDYYNNAFVEAEETPDNFMSLSDYFLIDNSDTEDNNSIGNLGRSNELTTDFKNEVCASYYGRLNNMVKMWITTWGISNICPGDRVQVLFAQGVASGSIASYQYSGYYLVERIVHSFGDTHRMKVLLSRNGLDTDKYTTLMQATKKVR